MNHFFITRLLLAILPVTLVLATYPSSHAGGTCSKGDVCPPEEHARRVAEKTAKRGKAKADLIVAESRVEDGTLGREGTSRYGFQEVVTKRNQAQISLAEAVRADIAVRNPQLKPAEREALTQREIGEEHMDARKKGRAVINKALEDHTWVDHGDREDQKDWTRRSKGREGF